MSRKLTVIVVVVVVAGVLAAPGFLKGQDGRAQKPSFEPRSRPGAGQKFLEKFVGDWLVLKKFYPRSRKPFEVHGECKQTMIQDGRFLQSVFTFGNSGAKTTGLGLIGFEPETGTFTSVWIDSRQTKMSLRQSSDKFDGKKIILQGKSLTQEGKPASRSRTETYLEEDGHTIVHRQYQLGQSERLIMELILTRKKPDSRRGP